MAFNFRHWTSHTLHARGSLGGTERVQKSFQAGNCSAPLYPNIVIQWTGRHSEDSFFQPTGTGLKSTLCALGSSGLQTLLFPSISWAKTYTVRWLVHLSEGNPYFPALWTFAGHRRLTLNIHISGFSSHRLFEV